MESGRGACRVNIWRYTWRLRHSSSLKHVIKPFPWQRGGTETKCPPLPLDSIHPDVGGDAVGQSGGWASGAASCQSSGIFADGGQDVLPRCPVCSEVDATERWRPVPAVSTPPPEGGAVVKASSGRGFRGSRVEGSVRRGLHHLREGWSQFGTQEEEEKRRTEEARVKEVVAGGRTA